MNKVNSSPERHSFQKEGYVKRCKEQGEEPNPAYLAMYDSWQTQDAKNLVNPEWQRNNMEYDLRSSSWICDKAKSSENYAQNLYAALCNTDWRKLDVWEILKDSSWSCSWRSAGGIVSDMVEKGDYIDWYCSGIGSEEGGYGLDSYSPELDPDGRTFVPEGHITVEIREDLEKLGWREIPDVDE